MNKKPEFKESKRRAGASDDPAFDERPDFGEYPEIPDFDRTPIGVDEDPFAQAPAVGVSNSFDNFSDAFGQPDAPDAPDAFEDEDADYEYQLFSDEEHYGKLPRPDIFAAYPAEVQRKILEWTDRDVRARRDDESRRQDMVLRERLDRDRWRILIPVLIIVLGMLCAAIVGVMTKRALITIAFLVIPVAVIIAYIVRASKSKGRP